MRKGTTGRQKSFLFCFTKHKIKLFLSFLMHYLVLKTDLSIKGYPHSKNPIYVQ